jgi:hypothetical protein
MYQTHGFKS